MLWRHGVSKCSTQQYVVACRELHATAYTKTGKQHSSTPLHFPTNHKQMLPSEPGVLQEPGVFWCLASFGTWRPFGNWHPIPGILFLASCTLFSTRSCATSLANTRLCLTSVNHMQQQQGHRNSCSNDLSDPVDVQNYHCDSATLPLCSQLWPLRLACCSSAIKQVGKTINILIYNRSMLQLVIAVAIAIV